MTLFSWGNPRYFPNLPAPAARYFDVDEETRVLAHCHWQTRPWTAPTLIALHGLNGSSDAHYMKGLAAKAYARGMNVVRLNQRNCGDTEHLSAGLFHSGLTADAAFVMEELIAHRRPAGDRRRRIFARRQPGAEAGRRVRRPCARRARGRGGRLADHRDQRVHAGARTARQLALSVEFREGSEAADAAERALLARAVRPVAPRRASRRCAHSTMRSLRRSSDSRARRITTTAPARCASLTAFACRHWSSPPKTIRSCRPRHSVIRS